MPDATRTAGPARARADYEIRVTPCAHPVRVEFNGTRIAESTRAVVLHETRLPPTYYFPPEDVRSDLLTKTDHHTHCPFKGDASYWTLSVDGHVVENAAWSYEAPYSDAAADPRLHLVLSQQDFRLLRWWRKRARARHRRRGRARQSARELVAEGRLEGGLERGTHRSIPEFPARRRLPGRAQHGHLPDAASADLRHGLRLARRGARHQGDSRAARHPAPAEIRRQSVRARSSGARGACDAGSRTPMSRSISRCCANCTTRVPPTMSRCRSGSPTARSTSCRSRRSSKGGFSTAHLGQIYEILPMLGRVLEVHEQRRTATALLEIYLGQDTGKRVLNGQVKHGDGENIHAVIWFCDFRDSTPLSNSMGRRAYLRHLNRFFECMAGAVLEATARCCATSATPCSRYFRSRNRQATCSARLPSRRRRANARSPRPRWPRGASRP